MTQEQLYVKREYPVRIDQQNNYYVIKEILRYWNRLDATVRKHTREGKKSISKENYEFAKDLNFPPREIDLKYEVTTKNIKKETKTKGLSQLKMPRNKIPGWTIPTKN